MDRELELSYSNLNNEWDSVQQNAVVRVYPFNTRNPKFSKCSDTEPEGHIFIQTYVDISSSNNIIKSKVQ